MKTHSIGSRLARLESVTRTSAPAVAYAERNQRLAGYVADDPELARLVADLEEHIAVAPGVAAFRQRYPRGPGKSPRALWNEVRAVLADPTAAALAQDVAERIAHLEDANRDTDTQPPAMPARTPDEHPTSEHPRT